MEVGEAYKVKREITNGGHGLSISEIMEPLMTASMNQATPDSAFFIKTSIGRGVAL